MIDGSAKIRAVGPVLTELHASVCALLGALLLAGDAVTLTRAESPWSALAAPMAVGSALGALAAACPWVWPGIPLFARRVLIWGGWFVATISALCVLIPLEYDALLGAQLLLVAAVLPEMSGRPASLRWFWAATILALAIMLFYREFAALRPVAD